MMTYFFRAFSLVLVLVITIVGCTEEARKRMEPTPLAVGSLNQLSVIADEELWNGPIGDSIRYYFGSAFPILPQPEALFDLKHFTPDELIGEPVRKELKAYLVVADLSNDESSTSQMIRKDIGEEKTARAMREEDYSTNVGHDRWAKDQLLVYLFGSSEQNLVDQLIKKFTSIAKVVQNHYEEQIDASVYLGGVNHPIINKIQSQFGFYLKIPSTFDINIEDDSTLWLIYEGDVAVSNILIHKRPYMAQDQFTKANILALQNELGKKYVSSTLENSYMRVNDVDLPVFTQSIQLGDHYTVEARGIWEMVGDFMGGPFITYLILDEQRDEVIILNAFVLAPGERKRNFMLYLEQVLQSFDLKSGVN
ncbi:MAG: DUF4837 family protein [Saprospiraceae bacterium]|nr:DUF4837 family protein [Saprospiraceae bacterium]